MIRYHLKCAEGHEFDSWFQSASAFEALEARGLLSCSVCGSAKVEKALMAPRVGSKDSTEEPQEATTTLSGPTNKMEEALTALRKHVDENSTYVGEDFAREARAIHVGEAPERLIHGEASPEAAKSLIEDGVPVAPLPVLPKNRSN